MAAAPAFDWKGTYDENLPLPDTLTIEQYRRVIFRPDAHFVDGRIVPRALGDFTHSSVIGQLIGAFSQRSRGQCMNGCVSLRLQVSPNRVRVCDFVALEKQAPREAVPTVPPLLCIEVLSPGQIPTDELETLHDYLRMGVANIWLIDPIRRSAFTFGATGLQETDPTNLKVAGTPIHLDLTEAFAAID